MGQWSTFSNIRDGGTMHHVPVGSGPQARTAAHIGDLAMHLNALG